MTGFAAAHGETAGIDWRWDVRTLNGRGLDMRVRLPQGYEGAEAAAREMIARIVARGTCQASLQVRRAANAGELVINDAALERVLELVGRVREATGADAPRADGILALKGVLELAEPADSATVTEQRNADVLEGLAAALEDLATSREREGTEIARNLGAQVDEIAALVASITALPARGRAAQLERLRGQLERLLESGVELSSERLYQEAALLATKADIREELDRLNSHVEAARGLLGEGGPVGRRLDFLSQEFNREANTICSKAGDIETTRLGLELKAVIDQFREQVQNVE